MVALWNLFALIGARDGLFVRDMVSNTQTCLRALRRTYPAEVSKSKMVSQQTTAKRLVMRELGNGGYS